MLESSGLVVGGLGTPRRLGGVHRGRGGIPRMAAPDAGPRRSAGRSRRIPRSRDGAADRSGRSSSIRITTTPSPRRIWWLVHAPPRRHCPAGQQLRHGLLDAALRQGLGLGVLEWLAPSKRVSSGLADEGDGDDGENGQDAERRTRAKPAGSVSREGCDLRGREPPVAGKLIASPDRAAAFPCGAGEARWSRAAHRWCS